MKILSRLKKIIALAIANASFEKKLHLLPPQNGRKVHDVCKNTLLTSKSKVNAKSKQRRGTRGK